MITNQGKDIIKRYFTGQVPQIGGALAFGVGTTAANVADTQLVNEVYRAPVASVNADLSNSRLVFKSVIPAGSINTIYEVGLYSGSADLTQRKNITLYGGNGLWTNGAFTATNARASAQAVKIDYVANGTTNAEVSGIAEDFSSFVNSDSLVVGFYATTNLSSVRIRLGTDASNYYEAVIAAPVASSYNVHKILRSAMTKTGTPTWDAITYMAARPSATAGGAGSIYLDTVGFQSNMLGGNNVLVARWVLVTPKVTDLNIVSEVEYSLGFSIT